MIIIYASLNYLQLNLVDIKSAFLQATLREPLIMKSSPGIVIPEDSMFIIVKSLYGLKEAPNLFGYLLEKALKEI